MAKKVDRKFYNGGNHSSLHYYKSYCDGWNAFLLHMPPHAPLYLELKAHVGNNDGIISQMRESWYKGYYDARTDHKLGSVLGREDKIFSVREMKYLL